MQSAVIRIKKSNHYPRLDTVLMVEEAVRRAKEEPTRMTLWRSLPKKTQYPTFQLILKYLEASNKVIITAEGKIVWIFGGNRKSKRLLGQSKPYRRGNRR